MKLAIIGVSRGTHVLAWQVSMMLGTPDQILYFAQFEDWMSDAAARSGFHLLFLTPEKPSTDLFVGLPGIMNGTSGAWHHAPLEPQAISFRPCRLVPGINRERQFRPRWLGTGTVQVRSKPDRAVQRPRRRQAEAGAVAAEA